MESCEYRWKLVTPYYQRTDKAPYLKGEWMTSRKKCLKDFLFKYEKNQLKLEEEDKRHDFSQAYLYKRILLPTNVLILGKCDYTEYKYKTKACFYRHEHLWTMHESKWGPKLRKTLKDLRDLNQKGYDMVD